MNVTRWIGDSALVLHWARVARRNVFSERLLESASSRCQNTIETGWLRDGWAHKVSIVEAPAERQNRGGYGIEVLGHGEE